MRRWPWLVLSVLILAGLGWQFGTPYLIAGRMQCTRGGVDCSPKNECDYFGLQGRVSLKHAGSCPFVKLLKWDDHRRLFNLATARSPRPPLPAGKAYCNGPSGPINPGDGPDKPDCVDP